MRIRTLLASLPFLLLLGNVAEAKPKSGDAAATTEEKPLPVIVETGVSEFDSVFMKAKGIHDTIDEQNAALKDAKKGLNKAVGVAEDGPLSAGFASAKAAANGKIKLDMSGPTPRVKPSEGAPDNAQDVCTAINKLLDAGEKSIGVAKGLEPQAKEVASAAAAFPAKLMTMNLDVDKLMAAKAKLGNDVKATAATPDRVSRLVSTSEDIFTQLKAAFTE